MWAPVGGAWRGETICLVTTVLFITPLAGFLNEFCRLRLLCLGFVPTFALVCIFLWPSIGDSEGCLYETFTVLISFGETAGERKHSRSDFSFFLVNSVLLLVAFDGCSGDLQPVAPRIGCLQVGLADVSVGVLKALGITPDDDLRVLGILG